MGFHTHSKAEGISGCLSETTIHILPVLAALTDVHKAEKVDLLSSALSLRLL